MALEADVPIIPCAVSGTDSAMPSGRRLPRRAQVTVTYGAPLDLSRYRDRRGDPFALRSATDELMYEIMRLSGQEYVDEYAATAKAPKPDPDGSPEAEAQRTREAGSAETDTRRRAS